MHMRDAKKGAKRIVKKRDPGRRRKIPGRSGLVENGCETFRTNERAFHLSTTRGSSAWQLSEAVLISAYGRIHIMFLPTYESHPARTNFSNREWVGNEPVGKCN